MKKIKNFIQEKAKELAPATGLALGIVVTSIVLTNLLYHEKTMIKRGYEVEITTDSAVKKEEKILALPDLMKLADATRGAKVAKKCASCHNIAKGAAAKVGPNLYAVVGRAKGSMAGFSYSEGMKGKGGSWDRDSLNQFLTKPKEYIAGTKMAFAGLKKPQDRADVILFLESQR